MQAFAHWLQAEARVAGMEDRLDKPAMGELLNRSQVGVIQLSTQILWQLGQGPNAERGLSR